MPKKTRPPGVNVVYTAPPERPAGDPYYALEKFEIAVHMLCTHKARIRDRLEDVFVYLLVVSESDLPHSLREEWRKLKLRMTRKPGKGPRDCSIWATMRGIRNAEASGIADRILYIRDTLSQLLDAAERAGGIDVDLCR